MGAAEKFGEKDARLAEALVVALQAGKNQVEIFRPNRGGQRTRGGQRIELEEFVVGDVDAAVCALGQGFLDGLFYAFGAHGDGDHFAVVLFLQAQGFFERVAVGLVGFKADVGFANPRAAFDDGEGRVLGGNLFDANADFHDALPAATERKAHPSPRSG